MLADARAPEADSSPAILVLEDGRTFHGRSFGARGETFGEAVFSTGMSGYQETLTDPSYDRQVVVATAPHIGNTGWNDEDDESGRIWVAGYVVRDAARLPSSWRSRRSLDQALRDQGVVGMRDVDTRALTRHLRERGAMRVGVSSVETDPARLLERVLEQPQMHGAHLADEVSTAESYVVPADGDKRFTVVALDLGIKSMTPFRMAERGIEVHVLPATASYAEVAAHEPDGVFFSNGPGDPEAAEDVVEVLREVLAAGTPYFGICFGNQLFGRALGFPTFKLVYGHRGINQPVMDLTTRKVEITAHNHGFAVDAPLDRATETRYGLASVSHVNLNDSVVEGLELRDADGALLSFSVQYHPEAAAGPHDASYLFDRFGELMTKRATKERGLRPEPVEGHEGMRPEPVEGQEGMRPEPVEGQEGMRPEPVEGHEGMRPEPVEGHEGMRPEPVEGHEGMRPEPVEGHESGASTGAVLSSSKGSARVAGEDA